MRYVTVVRPDQQHLQTEGCLWAVHFCQSVSSSTQHRTRGRLPQVHEGMSKLPYPSSTRRRGSIFVRYISQKPLSLVSGLHSLGSSSLHTFLTNALSLIAWKVFQIHHVLRSQRAPICLSRWMTESFAFIWARSSTTTSSW